MKRTRTVSMAVVMLVMAGCGESGGDVSGPREATPELSPEPPLTLPDGWPNTFPDPPSGAELTGVLLAEGPNWNLEGTQEIASHVTYQATYELDGEPGDALGQVREHYESSFPAADWEILRHTQKLTADDRFGLQISGPAHATANVYAHFPQGKTVVLVKITESDPGRAPYSAYPPLIDVPAWVVTPPEPPEDAVRGGIEIREDVDEPDEVTFQYRIDDPGPGDFARALEHYRTIIPAGGWTITAEDKTSEDEEGVERDVAELELAADGATADLTLYWEQWEGAIDSLIDIGFSVTAAA